MKRWLPSILVLMSVLCAALSGCGGSNQVTPDPSASDFRTIRIGKGLTHESETIAYLYANVLKKAGYSTDVVDSPKSRAEYLAQMRSNGDDAVDITPDYSGNLLLELTDGGRKNPNATASPSPSGSSSDSEVSSEASGSGSASPSASASPSDAFNVHGMSSTDITATLPKVLPKGLEILHASAAENKDALVVSQITAARYKLSTIDDLADRCEDLTFGVPAGFEDKAYGSAGLSRLYKCVPGKYETVDDQEELSRKLADGSVDVADIFSASAVIKDDNYVVLEDPKANFIAQQVTPVVRSDELPSSAKDAINGLSGELQKSDLEFLNRLTTGDEAVSAEDAADFWLKERDS